MTDPELEELPQPQTALETESTSSLSASLSKLPRQLSAFRHRNYRLFFFGQIISLTGTWMQMVAQGWLVLQLLASASPGHRAFMMGIVSGISALPVLLFSLPAGVLADRFSKRTVLVITQTTAMALALVFAGLTEWKLITVYQVMIIGFLLGTVNSVDAPTRQAFVIEMVGREDLTNAIALNSAMFNGARVAGPAVAGLVIAAIGLAGAFFLNGISFIAVIIGLLMMNVKPKPPQKHEPAWAGLKDGLRFIRHNAMVGSLLGLTAAVSIFGTSYMVLMPIFAKDLLHGDATHLGYLMSAIGVGALAGAVTLSHLGDFPRKAKLLIVGNLVFCISMAGFSFVRTMPVALALLPIAGWGIMTNMALTNTLIQTSTPDHMRGRVMSAYTLVFMGFAPLGSFQAGVVAKFIGVPWTIVTGAAVCAVTALALAPVIIRADRARNAETARSLT